MVNIRIVDGLRGILKKPISPAVMISGIILGRREMNMIRISLNCVSRNKEIRKIARRILIIKCLSI